MQVSEDLFPKFLRKDRPDTRVRWPNDSTAAFEESQKFNVVWFWILVFDFVFVSVIFLVTKSPWWAWITIGLIHALIMIMFRKMKLRLRIDHQGVYLHMDMVYTKEERKIPWSEIASVQVRSFTGFMEGSGYGKKVSRKKSFYNLNGNKAIDLQLRNGSQLVIGTRHAEEVTGLITRFA